MNLTRDLFLMWCEDDKGRKAPIDLTGQKPWPDVKKFPYAFNAEVLNLRVEIYRRRKSDGGYGGKDSMGAMNSSVNGRLLAAMIAGANSRRAFKPWQAFLIVGRSCERCLNALFHRYGLPGGYAENSKQFRQSKCRCIMCK